MSRHPTALFIALGLLTLGAAAANICLGSILLPLSEVWAALSGDAAADPVMSQIIVDFRLPRTLTALLAGSALSVAGILMQTVFRNPLADPFVLGVNSGASLGVALVLLVLSPAGVALTSNLELSGHLLVIAAASLGAASVLSIVLLFSKRLDVMSLLILGLMMSYGVGALVSIMMFFSMAERLQSFFSWSFGSFGNVTWSQLQLFGPTLLLTLAATLLLSKPLDALLLGERYAQSLGVAVKPARIAALTLASVLAGSVTGFCGPIGFLGIAAPHLARFLFQTAQHRILVPASLLCGASIALIADLIAKAPGFDTSLPLNAITALCGAPIIIAALLKQRSLRHLFGR